MNQRALGRAFLQQFAYIDKGFKLKLKSSDVRKFLKNYQNNQNPITFQDFNKLMHCEGRSTDNKYVYDLIGISNALKGKVSRQRQKNFSGDTVKVLNYYGSKRSWREEYELLYKYTHSLGCNTLVDACAGSGYLSLLAARTGFFERVILNELSNIVYSYHLVQKDEKDFEEFCYYLDRFGDVDDFIFKVMEKKLDLGQREYRRNISKGNATQAAALAIVKNYMYSGQGGYIKARMPMCEHIEALKRAQLLYKSIELSHLHYRKVTEAYMANGDCVIVLDVPYMAETRGMEKSYTLEFSERQHRNLLQLLTKQTVKAKIILCGYHSDLYQNYFMRYNKTHGNCWHEVKLLRAGSKAKGAEAKERIWVNFEVQGLVAQNPTLFQILW